MKTKWITSKRNSPLIFVLAAVLGLSSLHSCEDQIIPPPPEDVLSDSPGIFSEYFRVDPEGTTVYALEGKVALDFPEQSVTKPTMFILELVPLDPMEMCGSKMENCGIFLNSVDGWLKFEKSVQLKLNYCARDIKSENAVNEDSLTIFSLIPGVYKHPIGECCVDNTWDMISGCIDECGIYVVGEK